MQCLGPTIFHPPLPLHSIHWSEPGTGPWPLSKTTSIGTGGKESLSEKRNTFTVGSALPWTLQEEFPLIQSLWEWRIGPCSPLWQSMPRSWWNINSGVGIEFKWRLISHLHLWLVIRGGKCHQLCCIGRCCISQEHNQLEKIFPMSIKCREKKTWKKIKINEEEPMKDLVGRLGRFRYCSGMELPVSWGWWECVEQCRVSKGQHLNPVCQQVHILHSISYLSNSDRLKWELFPMKNDHKSFPFHDFNLAFFRHLDIFQCFPVAAIIVLFQM